MYLNVCKYCRNGYISILNLFILCWTNERTWTHLKMKNKNYNIMALSKLTAPIFCIAKYFSFLKNKIQRFPFSENCSYYWIDMNLMQRLSWDIPYTSAGRKAASDFVFNSGKWKRNEYGTHILYCRIVAPNSCYFYSKMDTVLWAF